MLLVVRSRPQLQQTVNFFSCHEVEAIGCAISDFTLHNEIKLPLQGAVVLTSPVAAPLLKGFKGPVFCVGESTADTLRACGVEPALVGNAGAAKLAEQIIKTQPCQPLTHLHADVASTSWHQTLREAGFKISSQVAYTTTYKVGLEPEITQKWGNIKQVAFFSAKSAEHFERLRKQAGLRLNNRVAVCLSAQVAGALASEYRVKTATKPTKDAMLTALKE